MKSAKLKIVCLLVLTAFLGLSYLVSPADAGDQAIAQKAAPTAKAADQEPVVLFKRTRTITETPAVVESSTVCENGVCRPVSRLRTAVTERTVRTSTERRSRRGGFFSRLFNRRSLGQCSG